MQADINTWSNSGDWEREAGRWRCPACGEGFSQEAFAGGRRMARCRRCSQMVRKVIPGIWPTSPSVGTESAPHPQDWQDFSYQSPTAPLAEQLELAPSYPPPSLQCPYCEHLSRDMGIIRANGQQFCANCGGGLKKLCLNCTSPMYVLDYHCPVCRSDQEKLKYEIEALYWQQYNEGKRLAQLGRWYDAEQALAIFFRPSPQDDPEEVRRARQVYASNLAATDGGEGLQLYNEAVEQLRQNQAAEQLYLQRQQQRRQWTKWGAIGGALLLMGIFSATTLGSWWAIFLVAPVVVFLLVIILFFLASMFGLG